MSRRLYASYARRTVSMFSSGIAVSKPQHHDRDPGIRQVMRSVAASRAVAPSGETARTMTL
jgi:hypothetical protein